MCQYHIDDETELENSVTSAELAEFHDEYGIFPIPTQSSIWDCHSWIFILFYNAVLAFADSGHLMSKSGRTDTMWVKM